MPILSYLSSFSLSPSRKGHRDHRCQVAVNKEGAVSALQMKFIESILCINHIKIMSIFMGVNLLCKPTIIGLVFKLLDVNVTAHP